MRETFPQKERGDRLEAKQVNALSEIGRRAGVSVPGSFITGLAGGTFSAQGPLPRDTQAPVEITEDLGDCLYRCNLRYYSHSQSKWKSQTKEWQLDASALGMTFTVGDIVIAYWQEQRGKFIPIVYTDPPPLLEVNGDTTSTVVKETGGGSCGHYVEFWLERKADGESAVWSCIDDRSFFINAHIDDGCSCKISGTGFITFLASDHDQVRLVVRSGSAIDVTVDEGIIKLKGKWVGGITTTDVQRSNQTAIDNMTKNAEVANEDGVHKWPRFELLNDASPTLAETIKIHTPLEAAWTIEADFAITIEVDLEVSSFSASSTSSSSSSVTSSSSSLTSSSSITSSSSSITSSSSSSATSSSSTSTSSSSSSITSSSSSDVSGSLSEIPT